MGVLNKYGGDLMMTVFQSPQWGVILKTTYITTNDVRKVSVPAMGKAF